MADEEGMDPLSDLVSAERFAALLAREEIRRSRTGESLVVVVLDVDGLKVANASHGVAAGAAMLRLCADVLQRSLRALDQPARTGADEFAVLMHATDVRSATTWADRFADELELAGRDHPAAPITCALGMADTEEGRTLPEVFARARRRMEVIQMARKLRRAREERGLG